ncbi:MAG: acyl-CoA carboxylase subunit beta [Nitrospinota bacterium]
MQPLLQELRERVQQAHSGGGPEALARQREQGKLTARERHDLLLDPGTFSEVDLFVTTRCTDFGMDRRRHPGDGVVTGSGKVDGNLVFVASQDFTVIGGSLGEMHADKIAHIQDLALKSGSPVVLINDSGGARIHEGVPPLNGYGKIFFRNTLASGVIPQVSVILGPCAGGAVYSPGLTDFVFMVEGMSKMFVTGPDVIKAVTGEEVTLEELGGATVHGATSGVAHFVCRDEEECFALIRKLLSFLPSNNTEDPPLADPSEFPPETDEELEEVVPVRPAEGYDVREVIRRAVDHGDFLEVHAGFAQSIVVGFARLGGRAVGIVANQPSVLAGVLDIDSSDKAARFIRFCDAFNFPLVNFVDVPGYMPGTQQEYGGIIRHGAKMLYAYSEATVPKVVLILRKAYGGAYVCMCSPDMGFDRILAYPTAEIAVMGPEGAANIIFRREIAEAPDPEAKRAEKIAEFREKFARPYHAAALGFVDAVIEPRHTRRELLRALETVARKRESRPAKKHGNPPL